MTSQSLITEEMVEASSAITEGRSVEELAQMAEEALEPGANEDQIVNRPTAENPLPMAVSEMKSAGYVVVFDRRTGEPSICNRNMLAAQFRKTRPDNPDGFPIGERVFTTDVKDIFNNAKPKRGTFQCLLHAEHPQRDYYAGLGLTTCRKANLKTALDVRRHMQARHKAEWASIEEDRRLKREREEDEVRRATLAAYQRLGSSAIPATDMETDAQPRNRRKGVSETCERCGEEIRAKNRNGIHFARMHHDKACRG